MQQAAGRLTSSESFRDLGFRVTENGQFGTLFTKEPKTPFAFCQRNRGGTINALFVSCRLEGTTLIENASLEPKSGYHRTA